MTRQIVQFNFSLHFFFSFEWYFFLYISGKKKLNSSEQYKSIPLYLPHFRRCICQLERRKNLKLSYAFHDMDAKETVTFKPECWKYLMSTRQPNSLRTKQKRFLPPQCKENQITESSFIDENRRSLRLNFSTSESLGKDMQPKTN